MLKYLIANARRGRQALEKDLSDSPRKRLFSPATYTQFAVTLPAILQNAHGRLIDLGCGDMPFRQFVVDRVTGYDSLDYFPRTAAVTYQGDIQNMTMIANGTYDTAVCLEVLEHVPDPFRAAREIYRILRPGGRLILSVPHMSRLHDEPYDFYRYTRYGVRQLLEQAGFEVLALEKRGGLLSFLGHQCSTIALSMTWGIPAVRDLAWYANSWLITRPCAWLDARLDPRGVFAMGYTAVAAKGQAS